MKKLFKSLLVVALMFTMTACGKGDDSSKDSVTLTIGISPDYPPYESLDTDGNIIGFDADMVALFEDYLTEEEGVEYKLEFKQMDFSNIVTSLQGDQLDLGISGFTYDEKRVVEWSDPYTATAQVAVMPSDTNIKSVSDLEGKKIAAQTGSTGEDAAKTVKNADVVSMDDVQDIFTGLAAHQYDVAIVDIAVGQNYVNNGNFVYLDETLMDEENYIIAKKGNTEVIEKINKCIEKFLASDDYDQLCEKYGLKQLEK
ncbi:transporter substrate-binding domain-containing protein [Thomasclavelia sp.]|uniref:transporter substrate-binding domain-containing protein n=1 Tax=Thomasclavelia sp. TaxID=3025757 RepID=UPI0025EF1432|nr:transporter substrate-binding domain-containing protein [Thomasclavelia sp.]